MAKLSNDPAAAGNIDAIRIRGAREHNLKCIDVMLPRGSFTAITGVSGSGKSSLAFDTIYAEAQRRYVESLGGSAKQFLEQWRRPEVDSIEGLCPAVAVPQRAGFKNPRSTIGTLTEIYDYLRVLFARAGTPWCNKYSRPLRRHTPKRVVDELMQLPEGTRLQILSPVSIDPRTTAAAALRDLARRGFVRVRLDGEIYSIEDCPAPPENSRPQLEIVLDRLVVKEGIASRTADSVESALALGGGLIRVLRHPASTAAEADFQWPDGLGPELLFSERFACLECGLSFEDMEPSLFSFNNARGMCRQCGGLGRIAARDGAQDSAVRDGGLAVCSACGGTRLRPEARAVVFEGKTIAEIVSMKIDQASDFFAALPAAVAGRPVVQPLLRQISERLSFLLDVGLDYLTLGTPAPALSGGEVQRIRLAGQLGFALSGVLYVLDEPSAGLHQYDIEKLIETIFELKNRGNTVLVVEHDEQVIARADFVVDLGPGAGEQGGKLIASGTPAEICRHEGSITGHYLAGTGRQSARTQKDAERRAPGRQRLTVHGARHNNLKNVTVEFPLGLICCVTGVSGSGKTSLVLEVLQPALQNLLNDKSRLAAGEHDKVTGWDVVERLISVDQSPLGRTARSVPATGVGAYSLIRELFASVPEARARGYSAARFSFNVKGGRCEICGGAGLVPVEMQFMPDVMVVCSECEGARFNRETLEIRYKGLNITEVLSHTVDQALEFFRNQPAIHQRLKALAEVGLGYIEIGRSAATLSGGEAQRVKLAAELARRQAKNTLYIFDEPTTGLHPHDVERLNQLLNRLVDLGNSVIVVEHNLDVISRADWVIDLGPFAGPAGGSLVAAGPPPEIAAKGDSPTAAALRRYWEVSRG